MLKSLVSLFPFQELSIESDTREVWQAASDGVGDAQESLSPLRRFSKK